MKVVHVVAAAIFGADGRLLISRRPDHLHQGGLLEFPGGKIDSGEGVTQALIRELQEELGITPVSFEPLLQIPYDYPDKRVLLDVWRVTRYLGEPRGLEGQALYWLGIDELDPGQFPAANSAIITALRLPQQYLVTGTATDAEHWLSRLQAALDTGIRLVQLRAPELDALAYQSLTRAALARCRASGARLILNRDPRDLGTIEADGLHLNRHSLLQMTTEQLAPWRRGLLGASCHNAAELALAQRLGVDYALMSPVLPTASHPGAEVLGWAGFNALVATAALPVYALGGLSRGMERTAIKQGAQGIASISAFW
ncbi:MAG: 8-oxo-dGTP diphosphatase [Motiliproteus sp.]|jgi:8-oxo-dGTP diphosphatase